MTVLLPGLQDPSTIVPEAIEWSAGDVAYCFLIVRGVVKAAQVLVVQSDYCQSVVAVPASCAISNSGDWAGTDILAAQPWFYCACADDGLTCALVFHSLDTHALVAAALPGALEFRTSDATPAELTKENVLELFNGTARQHSDRILTVSGRAAECPCYHEVTLTKGSILFHADSVLLIPDFLTKAECRVLMEAADDRVDGVLDGSLEEIPELCCRPKWSEPGRRPDWLNLTDSPSINRVCISSMGCPRAEALSSSIIMDRVLPFFEQHLPQVAMTLFGHTSRLKQMDMRLSDGEPAVNRYTEGGQFGIHSDKLAITLNVLLSEPGAFGGGGTAFWSQETQAIDQAESLLLKPRQGMGVIFNGAVEHSGRPVEWGTRHVYVVSFDLEWNGSLSP